MAFEKRISLQGSERQIPEGARQIGPVAPEEEIAVTLVLRRKRAGKADRHLSHAEFQEQFGVPEEDFALVRQFAQGMGLSVAESSPLKSTVRVTGTVQAMQTAFGVQLHHYQFNEQTFRGCAGGVTIPEELGGQVIGGAWVGYAADCETAFSDCPAKCCQPIIYASASSGVVSLPFGR